MMKIVCCSILFYKRLLLTYILLFNVATLISQHNSTSAGNWNDCATWGNPGSISNAITTIHNLNNNVTLPINYIGGSQRINLSSSGRATFANSASRIDFNTSQADVNCCPPYGQYAYSSGSYSSRRYYHNGRCGYYVVCPLYGTVLHNEPGLYQIIADGECGYDRINTGCFIAGTKVLINSLGKTKNIEDVNPGDTILSSKGLERAMIVYHIKTKANYYAFNGTKNYFVSEAHPFMTTQGWKSINPQATNKETPKLQVSKLQIGDTLIMANGKTMRLKALDSKLLETTVYNFGINGSHDFYADGFRVHGVTTYPVDLTPIPLFQKEPI